ncbi:hypothetical protein [Mycolicibacillus parakoreensis]|uniref:Lipoprotein n=1 Tax=Mycolicibacillus parakoreensis TaxID=1069221 RepID=A0ABY3U1C7_9MYCO|nr:hypothetical protein [Mycolicibacillus parakoreensis]ULN52476.1 hypothetical protein MIU77_16805 [Mycolicibacillus parakoreensis]
MTKALLAAAGAGVLLVGCTAVEQDDEFGSRGDTSTVSTPAGPAQRPDDQEPNAPIAELLSLQDDGVHCFARPAGAVAAQLRASKAADAANAKLTHEAEDEPYRPAPGQYLQVSDVGETQFGALCYRVTAGQTPG